MSAPRTPYRFNVVGDFYVEDGCCTLCGVPWDVAPDLFEPTPEGCYVKKQPATLDEVGRMVEVIASQELSCVRYKGRDGKLLEAIRDVGEADCCDFSLTDDPKTSS